MTDPADYPPPFKATAHATGDADGKHKTEKMTRSGEGGTDLGTGAAAGEDDGSAPVEGEDGHLTEDQKPATK